MEAFHVELQQKLWSGLWNMWKHPFLAFYKLGIVKKVNVGKNQNWLTTFSVSVMHSIPAKSVKPLWVEQKILW